MAHSILRIHPNDNVAVALRDLQAGEEVSLDGSTLVLPMPVQIKHKFTLTALGAGDAVMMYGLLVGRANRPIGKGEVITRENTTHAAGDFTTKEREYHWSPPDVSRFRNRTFDGFHRSDGRVGTMNYWVIIPLVFCENRNVEVIHQALTTELGYSRRNDYRDFVRDLREKGRGGLEEITYEAGPGARHFENIDGIKLLTHQMGCGGTRQDAATLCGLLAGYVNHPNCGGATVLSLGCQNAQAELFMSELQRRNPNFDKPLIVLEQQKSRSEPQFIREALMETFKGLAIANDTARKPAPLSQLVIGVECGGSDGFSGISANPAIGHTSDLLVALGGTSVLSEFPELCGSEQVLLDRCVSREVADRFAAIQRAYAAAAFAVGSGFDMNPSPGNIRDGLITDAMKSAGAARKGGDSPVTDVLDYPEWVKTPGLNLLCTPGNDVESTTALAGAGTNLILFTTGLGTPTGNPICPTLKVSSNTALAKRMADIIDINAGLIIDGEKTIAEMGEEILELCIETASGRYTPKAVELGQDDFIPWKRGVSL